MNPQVDEIEEGEIVADELSDSSLNVLHSPKKKKSLPRRYTLKENKNVPSKHKKTCKHSIRHHAKKLLKFQKSPDKVQATSFTRRVSPKRTVRRINPGEKKPVNFLLSDKNIEEFSRNSLFSEMRGALKNLPSSKKSFQKSFLINNAEDLTLDNLDFPTLLADYKKIQEELKKYKANENVKADCNNLSTNLKENIAIDNDALKLCNESIQNVDNTSIQDSKIEHQNTFIPDSTIEQKTDESEDEDELRRLALATFAKKAIETENNDNSVGKESLGVNSVETLENASVNSCNSVQVTDNYEIVDMDLDEENLNSSEILEDDELFVIDTNPSWSANFQESNNSVSPRENLKRPVANQFDDEFEEELLRAQLLASMSGPKKEPVCQSSKAGALGKTISQIKNVKSLQIPPEKIPSKISANSLKKINVSKPNSDSITSINPQKRIIISLTNDSSTEESDTDEESVEESKETSSTAVNLEALISDARQKSDQSKSNEIMDVSCLSKAQQEEYNSYIKILNNTTSQAGANKKQKFPIEELKLKERKLLIAEQNCKKEQKLISDILKETFHQRRVYIKSKLKCQFLKEQLLAAERVKKLHLQAYQKSLIQVRTLKKSISKREDLIKSLKDECTKLQTLVTGQNFDLPTVPSDNSSNIDKPNL